MTDTREGEEVRLERALRAGLSSGPNTARTPWGETIESAADLIATLSRQLAAAEADCDSYRQMWEHNAAATAAAANRALIAEERLAEAQGEVERLKEAIGLHIPALERFHALQKAGPLRSRALSMLRAARELDADRALSTTAPPRLGSCNINLTEAEMQSGMDRVRWAEGLILQLPESHDGRNSWLLNYGKSDEAVSKRMKRDIRFDSRTQAAHGPDMNREDGAAE